MLTIKSPARAGAAGRSAFTLIELLVIVAILATVAALTAGAILRFVTVQQQNNTRTALNKIQAAIDKQVSHIKDAANREAEKNAIPTATMATIMQGLAGSDANASSRAKVIYTKLKIRQMFPETFDEVLNPQVPGMGMQSYVNYLAQYGINNNTSGGNGTSGAGGQFQYQSAVCLAMALQVGMGSGVNMEDLGKGGALGTIQVDPAVNSISAPALLDAWGTPICFSRFPAGCPRRDQQGAMTGTKDPLDPLGLLNNGSWAGNFQSNYQQVLLQRLTGQNNTSFYLWPVVASAGPDKHFGLWMNPGPNNASSGYFDFSEVGPEAKDNLYPE